MSYFKKIWKVSWPIMLIIFAPVLISYIIGLIFPDLPYIVYIIIALLGIVYITARAWYNLFKGN